MKKNSVKGFMFYVAFVASLGGLLFGFDTAVISGAEKSIQQIYGLSDFAHGFTIATALIGTIVGALVCSKPVDKYGRLNSLKVIAFLYLFSALGSALIVNWYSFIFFRFLGGIAVGASSVVGPMYIAEISPSHWRGRFVAFFQFNIVLGIVLAYLSNYFINGIPDDWRWMLGVLAIPALLFGILLYTVPESPRWLMQQRREGDARKTLERIGEHNIQKELTAIKESLVSTSGNGEKLFQKRYMKPLLYAFFIATFNQLSGINAILYYAPRIFEMSGLFRDSAMMQSIVIGLTNLVFTMIGMILIDKVGRKKLLYIGSIGMTIALALVARGFSTETISGYYMLVCLMGFIAFFAISLGATIWVIISEVFPNSVRSKGQVFGSMTHWVWSALLSWMFPVFIKTGGTFIFGFFAVMMALSFFFALKLPETKNKTLEQIQKELTT
ncbi:sugar porter family MFS transporter [Bacteroides sp.]|uniref:sugar porter family MFS transporter n=1 Tax=Bacteroides sp. TaxID=29523 RepID=UPI00260E42BE|nr:sugar porter family MFS transporter [Bacteroides sp.]MDD3036980.1 sugar porter family MFS transporter [Bacteroides sp.]